MELPPFVPTTEEDTRTEQQKKAERFSWWYGIDVEDDDE